MVVNFTLNGEAVSVEAPPDTPLLWIIRENLHQTGTKYGCGIGVCGACAVLVDNKPARSCKMPLSEAAGARVRTIESLPEDASHPVQQAWLELDVPQCGYCQSGQIMTAVALLEENPSPTDAEIDEAMDHVLCRCGTYLRIRKAVHRAAEIMASGAVRSSTLQP